MLESWFGAGPTSPHFRASPLGHGPGGLVWVYVGGDWCAGRVFEESPESVLVLYRLAGGWIGLDRVAWSQLAAHVRLYRVDGLDEWMDDPVTEFVSPAVVAADGGVGGVGGVGGGGWVFAVQGSPGPVAVSGGQ